MNQTLALGPLMLPAGLLVGVAAFLLASYLAKRLGGEAGAAAEGQVLRALLVGLVAARITFVIQFHDAYFKAPWSILDIRDGGWNAAIGLAVAAAYASVLLVLRPALRKPLAAAWLVGGAVWFVGVLALQSTAPVDVRMPALTLKTLQGEPLALSSFAGRPTVVNLWATWCPPCQREMPVLQQAQARSPGVHFVFLNQGEDATRVARYLQASSLQLRNVVLDSRGEAGTHLGHRALPTTLFFDATGRLVDTRTGELSEASLAERLQSPSFTTPAQ